ncbi:hypothetical protein DL93DRAFT_2169131 [Clavulina sp. PMI_390]|nr:hypothetical protein DL93DRAFT_2169131 [Clavulina sp. PMI_390]
MEDDSDHSDGGGGQYPPSSGRAPRKPIPQPRAKTFECPHCERRFDRPSLLAQHVLVHTGEKPHLCPKCNDKRLTHQSTTNTFSVAVSSPILQFARTSNLYRHMRTCKAIPPPSTNPYELASTTQAHLSWVHAMTRTNSFDHASAGPASDDELIRGVSPDPNWGPVPLAEWTPRMRRHHTSPPILPMPISQRIHISEAPLLAGRARETGLPPPPFPSTTPSLANSATSHLHTGSLSMPTPNSAGIPSSMMAAPDRVDWSITSAAGLGPDARPGGLDPFQTSLASDYAKLQTRYEALQGQGPSRRGQLSQPHSTSDMFASSLPHPSEASGTMPLAPVYSQSAQSAAQPHNMMPSSHPSSSYYDRPPDNSTARSH